MMQTEIAGRIPAVYAGRRARLAQLMQRGVAVVPTAPEQARNRDSHYPYRYDSYFYYLTGFPEPEAVLVLVAGDPGRSILFCRDKDAEREVWDGFRYGLERARAEFHFDESHSISELDTLLPKLLAGQPALHCHHSSDGRWDERVLQALNAVRAQARTGVTAPAAITTCACCSTMAAQGLHACHHAPRGADFDRCSPALMGRETVAPV